MDWIHLLALVYFLVVTPFASFGFVLTYALFAAWRADQKERKYSGRAPG